MNRILSILTLIFAPFLAFAQEVAEATTTVAEQAPNLDPSTLSGWQLAVYSGIILGVGFLVKLWRKRVNAAHDKDTAITSKELLANRQLLLQRVESVALRAADNHIIDHLPAVLVDAMNGDGKFDVKLHTMNAYKSVRDAVVADFKEEGIDILARLGEGKLNGLIKAAVDKGITALPEKVTAYVPKPVAKLATDFVAGFVTAKTSSWLGEAFK